MPPTRLFSPSLFIFIGASTILTIFAITVYTNHGVHEIVLDGAYNVPYFSTFLIPREHFTRGGLHQAAIPYERALKKKGIIDDDGVHYLSQDQGKQLADELNSAIISVLEPPTPKGAVQEENKPLTPEQTAKLAQSLEATQNYVFMPNHGVTPTQQDKPKPLTPQQAIQLSDELAAGIRYVNMPPAPAKPAQLAGLTLPQTRNLHSYLAQGLKEVYEMESPDAHLPAPPQLPAIKYGKGGKQFWNFIAPKRTSQLHLPNLKYAGEGKAFWRRLHAPPQAKAAAPQAPALKYGREGKAFWRGLHAQTHAQTQAPAATKGQTSGGAGFWKYMFPPRRTAARRPRFLQGKQLQALSDYLAPARALRPGQAPGLGFAV